jgi:hypothetical protein
MQDDVLRPDIAREHADQERGGYSWKDHVAIRVFRRITRTGFGLYD